MRYDTIIIGAGMSGLAAGIRLAQFDRRVTILERHSLWGGLNSFYTLQGRPFDVGLHALTNWAPARGSRRADGTQPPLTLVLRQLRIRHAELRLGQQRFSEILFPGTRLTFTNDFAHFQAEVERDFPSERDGFARLVKAVQEYDLSRLENADASARAVLGDFLRDRRLIDVLLLPTCYYGSAREHDVDWYQFVVLFRSIFLEGLSRPEGGIRPVLNLLVKRYRALGGEVRLRAGVRDIHVDGGAARGVTLEDGTELEADCILSSAGYPETMALCGESIERERVHVGDVGRLSFVESISVLDREPGELGHGAATSFYCTDDTLAYAVPDELVDVRSGVASSPNNFESEKPLREGMLRLTVLANHGRWCALPQEEYVRRKAEAADRAIGAVTRFLPDWRAHTVFQDVFTPRTIEHFTGHRNGAVYGSPRKRRDGATGIDGLRLCGTDQGYLGVVGALISGITMANRYALVAA